MIRILHVFHQMNMGGAESLIMNVYRNIDKAKFQFDFVVHTQEPGLYDEEIRKLGGNIYYIRGFKPYNIIQYKNDWKRFLKGKEYVVHCHISYSAAIIVKITKQFGLQTFVHSHNISAQGDPKTLNVIIKNSIVRLQKRVYDKYADYKLACSEEAGKWLFGNKGIKQNNFLVIKNGIKLANYVFNNDYRNEYREMFNISKDTFVVGHIGRFDEQKNHKFLLEIFKEVVNIRTNSALMLIGSGSLETAIKQKAKVMGLVDKIIFCGVRNDVPKILSVFDVLAFPSIYEGFGIVILEAQANGLKCFISDTIPSGVDISKTTRFLSLSQSPAVWAEEILTNSKRIEDTSTLIKEGYDILDVVTTLVNLYGGTDANNSYSSI